jgi:hypothetical protein
MLKEGLCNPSGRFLQAIMIFSDKTIKVWKDETIQRCKDKEKDIAYERFLNWTRQENEAAVFTTYAYADFSIPKHFDCIFNYDNPEIYLQINFVLTQSIWEGWYPIDYVDHGHKHLCVLTFENKIPDILNKLHCETEKYSNWTWDAKKVLGLCQMTDMQSIVDRRHKEIKLKELHGDNWYEFDDQT